MLSASTATFVVRKHLVLAIKSPKAFAGASRSRTCVLLRPRCMFLGVAMEITSASKGGITPGN